MNDMSADDFYDHAGYPTRCRWLLRRFTPRLERRFACVSVGRHTERLRYLLRCMAVFFVLFALFDYLNGGDGDENGGEETYATALAQALAAILATAVDSLMQTSLYTRHILPHGLRNYIFIVSVLTAVCLAIMLIAVVKQDLAPPVNLMLAIVACYGFGVLPWAELTCLMWAITVLWQVFLVYRGAIHRAHLVVSCFALWVPNLLCPIYAWHEDCDARREFSDRNYAILQRDQERDCKDRYDNLHDAIIPRFLPSAGSGDGVPFAFPSVSVAVVHIRKFHAYLRLLERDSKSVYVILTTLFRTVERVCAEFRVCHVQFHVDKLVFVANLPGTSQLGHSIMFAAASALVTGIRSALASAGESSVPFNCTAGVASGNLQALFVGKTFASVQLRGSALEGAYRALAAADRALDLRGATKRNDWRVQDGKTEEDATMSLYSTSGGDLTDLDAMVAAYTYVDAPSAAALVATDGHIRAAVMSRCSELERVQDAQDRQDWSVYEGELGAFVNSHHRSRYRCRRDRDDNARGRARGGGGGGGGVFFRKTSSTAGDDDDDDRDSLFIVENHQMLVEMLSRDSASLTTTTSCDNRQSPKTAGDVDGAIEMCTADPAIISVVQHRGDGSSWPVGNVADIQSAVDTDQLLDRIIENRAPSKWRVLGRLFGPLFSLTHDIDIDGGGGGGGGGITLDEVCSARGDGERACFWTVYRERSQGKTIFYGVFGIISLFFFGLLDWYLFPHETHHTSVIRFIVAPVISALLAGTWWFLPEWRILLQTLWLSWSYLVVFVLYIVAPAEDTIYGGPRLMGVLIYMTVFVRVPFHLFWRCVAHVPLTSFLVARLAFLIHPTHFLEVDTSPELFFQLCAGTLIMTTVVFLNYRDVERRYIRSVFCRDSCERLEETRRKINQTMQDHFPPELIAEMARSTSKVGHVLPFDRTAVLAICIEHRADSSFTRLYHSIGLIDELVGNSGNWEKLSFTPQNVYLLRYSGGGGGIVGADAIHKAFREAEIMLKSIHSQLCANGRLGYLTQFSAGFAQGTVYHCALGRDAIHLSALGDAVYRAGRFARASTAESFAMVPAIRHARDFARGDDDDDGGSDAYEV
jgi:hypothetical protein